MLSSILLAVVASTIVTAHTVITYPGWRGDNLIENATFPYGMQWTYPCGGIPLTTNRSYWPTTGGAVAFQPGWFQGHQTAFLYINLGFGTDGPDHGPLNMSFPMIAPFQLLGPSKGPYPGTVCLPQVPLPANMSFNAGDNATIQVVEIAQHGAALFSCSDITFAEPGDERIAKVNGSNCYNSTDLGFAEIYTVTTQEIGSAANVSTSSASGLWDHRPATWSWLGYFPIFMCALGFLL
ncbi:hypothetical protein F5Y00DRAFT_256161 [Daldinia vernicosa]|uniref:uncharacterized protein n=1 Tax=Daldinia vernicosa TaxID=114800 RepID=UPI00200898F4|nr:uncharacterized protein F5Y00DRAFT_256161 [Daldinia vernicosa]KAI0844287.1 hypothetical protein F5Y00DRAFT_256161 [Daldinia vernicosa]